MQAGLVQNQVSLVEWSYQRVPKHYDLKPDKTLVLGQEQLSRESGKRQRIFWSRPQTSLLLMVIIE